MAVKNKPNELYINRIYNASAKNVWEAWVDPDKVAKWWGPRGFTITTHSKDVRTGETWDYIMHGPDGTDWPNVTKYLEVEKHHRMVYDHGGSHTTPPLFRVTVEFTEMKGGRTKMEMTMALPTAEAAKETEKFIKKAGGNSTWDRLAEYLDKESSGKERFVINRTFKAPIEKMFEMWTNPEHFEKWMPPTGMTMKFIKTDVKVGGSSFYSMGNGDFTMYGSTHYKEITKPSRLVYTQDFRDKDGNMSKHPGAPVWPETMLTTVTLTEEGPNATRVTIEWDPSEKSTTEEIAAFVKAKSGMTQGWTGSLDKLEGYISL